MPSARLAYVALAVREPDAVAAVFEDALGLARTALRAPDGGDVPMFAAGGAGLALVDVDAPFLGPAPAPGLHHIALACDDPAGFMRAAGLSPDADDRRTGLGSASQLWIDPAAACGVRACVTEPVALPSGGDGRIERIDHLGVASLDNRRAVEFFSGTLGFPVESEQTDMEVRTIVESFTSDKYGVVYRNRPPVPVGGLRVSFITIGDCELEFLQDFDPSDEAAIDHGQPGTTKQDQGAIARFVARRGAGLHHVALKTPDIDGLLASLGAAGLRMIDRTGRPGSRRARIGFVHPASLGGVLMHFVERAEL